MLHRAGIAPRWQPNRNLLSIARKCDDAARRCYAQVASSRHEVVNIPCRSSGFISLHIQHHASVGGWSAPIVVYLSRGIESSPSKSTPTDGPGALNALSSAAAATVVEINYRAGAQHRFPTCVHDVLTGYDWILDNMLSRPISYDDDSSLGKPPRIARLGVCGELLGGSLATMLALTECKLGSHRIGAAYVNNPILDWAFCGSAEMIEAKADKHEQSRQGELYALTGQADAASKPTKRRDDSWTTNAANTTLPASMLLAAREQLFKRVEDTFDRFASPVHFFRSPAAEILTLAEGHADTQAVPLGHGRDRDIHDLAMQPDASSPQEGDEYDPFDDIPFEDGGDIEAYRTTHDHVSAGRALKPAPTWSSLVPCRSWHRVHPPVNLPLLLPHFHLDTSADSPLYSSHGEFLRFMQRAIARSLIRQSGGARDDGALLDSALAEASRKANMRIKPRVEHWDQDSKMDDVGQWLKKALTQR